MVRVPPRTGVPDELAAYRWFGIAPLAVVVAVVDGVELLQAAANKPKLVAMATIIILRFERPIDEPLLVW
jgi:hypothetical protein